MVQRCWGVLSGTLLFDCLLCGEARCGLLLVVVLCVIVVEGFGVVIYWCVVVEVGLLFVVMIYWFLLKDEFFMEVYCFVGECDVMCVCEFVAVMCEILLYDFGDVIVELFVDELVEYCMAFMVFYIFWLESVWWFELSEVECVWSDVYVDVIIEIFAAAGAFDLVLVARLLFVVIDGLLLVVFLRGGDGDIDELRLLFGRFVCGLFVG